MTNKPFLINVPKGATLPISYKLGDDVITVDFDYSDDNFNKFMEKVNKITALKNINSFDKLRPLVKSAVDQLLGVGTFDKLYAYTPSTDNVAQVLLASAKYVNEERQRLLDDKKGLSHLNTND